jgi:16S rRNA (guanine966-N2)-methyltransferase
MTLKIISGIFKNRKLKAPKNIRPATSSLRDAVFNISMPIIEGVNFLDLFSGSGAMGIEAISRGAAFSTMVDNSPISIRFIKENIKSLEIEGKTKIVKQDVMSFLKKTNDCYDIISIDPPFIFYKDNTKYINDMLAVIQKRQLIKPSGLIFIEEPTYSKRNPEIQGLKIKDKRKYGSAFLYIYNFI